jgi:hypothetical protein
MSGRDQALVLERDANAGGGAVLVRWQPWPHPNNSLAGHATVDFRGWVLLNIPVFRGRDGKRQFRPTMNFTGDGKARFERAVLGALAAAGVTV